MTDTRFLGYIAFAVVLWLIYQQWTIDYSPQELPNNETFVAPVQDLPEANLDLPTISNNKSTNQQPSIKATSSSQSQTESEEQIEVISDVLSLIIDLQGGNVVSAKLLNYSIDLEHPDKSIEILTLDQGYFVAQSGLQAKDAPAPDHYAKYTTTKKSFRLPEDKDQIQVPLTWSEDGIEVTKTFTIKRGKYDITVQHDIYNNNETSWIGRQYRQLQRTYSDEGEQRFIYTYTGGVIYSPEKKYEKIKFDDMVEKPLSRKITAGWAAMIQHYFLSAWVPNNEEKNSYYSRGIETRNDIRYVLGLSSEAIEVVSHTSHVFSSTLYVGPKIQKELIALAPGLELTVDYGFLTILAKPLFKLLNFIHGLIGNWGWSIVIVTLLIKMVFYKLAETSYRSMAKMRKVQPKMVALRERYADDKQRQSQALMELYKKEKINPLGGCLPMLVQIPVFIALYWMLLESVELRQADFIFWIKDLSVKDQFYVLPLIMGISMYFQQKLNPAPIDPVQAKVFMVLPFVFTVFFAFFPSGLVLYWVVNNCTTIAQQWFITKRVLAS